jgi:hypothetical protein
MARKNVNIYIDEDVWKKFQNYAEDHGTSASAMIEFYAKTRINPKGTVKEIVKLTNELFRTIAENVESIRDQQEKKEDIKKGQKQYDPV